MAKRRKCIKSKPKAKDYKQLIARIDSAIESFRDVQRETPEMFWWSIAVDEDITEEWGINAALYRWGALLKDRYKLQLCNLGGIGTKDRQHWKVFAVAGNGPAYRDYEKVAGVCIQGVDQLWLSEHSHTRGAVYEIFHVRLAEMALQRVERATWDGVGHELHDGHRLLWACERPTFSLGVKEYLDSFPEGMKERGGTTGTTRGGSYWTSMWFEFLFRIAQEPGGPLRARSGVEDSMGWEEATFPYRHFEHSICDASILALKHLRTEAERRLVSRDCAE